MPGTGPDLNRISQYTMRIECPQCGEKMVLHIGLIGDPKNNQIECIGCHNELLPLVSGPILAGPFPVTTSS